MAEPGVQPVEVETETKKVSSGLEPAMEDIYARSGAEGFGISPEQFAALMEEVAEKALPAAAVPPAKIEFCKTLRLEELVLARACASGNERAWEVFLTRYRAKLYEVARQITREDSSGRELADSVYADLFGTRVREGNRVSRLTYYCGRGSLEGWLRTVLAQEFVNTYRKQRRLVSLDEESEEGVQFAAPAAEPVVAVDPQLANAIDEALRSLEAEDRFVLASYFLDDRTLAQIARALSVHESTISRKVEKLTKGLRKQIMKNLVGKGMSRRQAEEALSADVRDLALDIRASLAQDSVPAPFQEKGAKAGEGGS
jgi:RNA polymerase sigma-70 factor, ECF subfamily